MKQGAYVPKKNQKLKLYDILLTCLAEYLCVFLPIFQK